MGQLQIDGWGVAQADVERRWGSAELPDRCWLFRSPATWTLVTMRRSVRYDDDQARAGSATIASRAFSTLDELAAEVERTYTSGAWVELLDAGYEYDADLYQAWVPEPIRRDFHGTSIHRKDLALYTGLGFEVLDERPAVEELSNDWGDPPSAGCGSVATGWEATGVARIDSTGEVFIRLDPDAVAGPCCGLFLTRSGDRGTAGVGDSPG